MLTVVVINNYLHDVATAVLLSSAVIMLVLGALAQRSAGASADLLGQAYPFLTRVAWGSIAWIVVGGVPRTLFFSRAEWDVAEVPGLLAALGAKHAAMFLLVLLGVSVWRRTRRSLVLQPRGKL